MIISKCPVCGSRKTTETLKTTDPRKISKKSGEFTYFKCSSCRTVYLTGIKIDTKYYSQAYGLKYYGGNLNISLPEKYYGAFINSRKRKVLTKLTEHMKSVHILDIGAGNLNFLNFLNEGEFKKSAIDIYKNKVVAEDIEVINDDFLKHDFKSVKYDLVTSWHVIEHIPDPESFVRKIYQILKPGGYLVISTPNSESFSFRLFGKDWYHLDAPRHLVLFNKESLIRLTEKSGLKFVEEADMFYEFPFDSLHSSKRLWRLLMLLVYPLYKLLSRETMTFVFQK